MINGDRIKQARELRGLTQRNLADSIETTQPTIAQIEKGFISPNENILQRIVLKTGFPLSFFKQPTSIDFPHGSLLFRARASLTSRERNIARQYARLIFEMANKMEEDFREIPSNLPRLDDDVLGSAIQTRSSFGLSPDLPIVNLINILEKNGVMIIPLPINLENHDAFSAWVRNGKHRPVIVLSNDLTPGDRLRFSVAHETGHLVMHQAMRKDVKIIEDEADQFAAEFLMPKKVMLKEIIPPVTLASLIPLKQKWKVSIQALILRAHDLDIITQRQYKYLMQQIAVRGWRLKEPVEIAKEKPRMISLMAELLYGIPINYKSLASNTNLSSQLVQEIIGTYLVKESQKRGSENSNGILLKFKKIDMERV